MGLDKTGIARDYEVSYHTVRPLRQLPRSPRFIFAPWGGRPVLDFIIDSVLFCCPPGVELTRRRFVTQPKSLKVPLGENA